jgi:hypothetical protein
MSAAPRAATITPGELTPVIRVITITGIGDHFRPEWPITITGMRSWAGPSLLAMILFEKFGQHQPLNRQCERFAREGVEVSLSILPSGFLTATGLFSSATERFLGDCA